MKKMKFGVMLLAATICTSMLTGCSAKDLFTLPSFGMNAEKVLSKSATAMKGVESFSIDMNMNYDVKVSAKDDDNSTTSSNVKMSVRDLNMGVIMDDENLKYAHLDGKVGIELLGIEESVPLESYVESDGKTYTTYTVTDGSTWEMSESDKLDTADSGVDVDSLLDFGSSDKDGWTLNKKKETLGNTKVYHLTKSVTEDEIKDIMSFDMDDLYASLGMSDVSTPDMMMNMYVDADTFYVVKTDLCLSGSDKDNKKTEKSGDVAVTFNEMSVDIEYDDFNSVKEADVKVSDKIKESAKSAASSDSLIGALESEGTDIGSDDDYKASESSDSGDVFKSKVGDYTISFGKFDKFQKTHTDDKNSNYMNVSSTDSRYDCTITSYSHFDGKDTVDEERKSTNDYYKSQEDAGSMKEVYIGDVTSTNVSGFTAYYYRVQYTHVDSQADFGYVSNTYTVYVDMGDGNNVEIKVSEMVGEGENTSLDDTMLESVLSHISIKK